MCMKDYKWTDKSTTKKKEVPTNKEHHGNHKTYGLKREQKNSLDNERYLLKKWVWRQDLKTSNRYPKHRKYRGNAR